MTKRTTYVVLLRGINIGKRRLAMADLRAMCEGAGCSDVSTYVQSGNVVLTSTLGEAALVKQLEAEIAAGAGFDVPVVARTAKEMAKVVSDSPLDPSIDDTKRVVMFLSAKPTTKAFAAFADGWAGPEESTLVGREVHVHYPAGQGNSKLTAATFDKALGVVATARNWRSVTTLADLVTAT